MQPNTWAILGIHGQAARVRICLRDGTLHDGDVPLPGLHSSVHGTEALYAHLMAPAMEARIAELNALDVVVTDAPVAELSERADG